MPLPKRVALLAPVPCIHIHSALPVIQAGGTLAFGTGKLEMFADSERVPPGIRALIYVSQTDGYKDVDAAKLAGGVLAGTYTGWTMADRRGRYAGDPAHRPPTAHRDDTAWTCFFTVHDLRWCSVPLGELRHAGTGRRVAVPLRGPELVDDLAG
ncbi:hypothetical protein [Roseomonas sp. BN140053]|uniref:hypothetical protein n=1 Tax=Roseomonas sp. BN140053 TaxID=3391898 RepID=UPI0039E9C85A